MCKKRNKEALQSENRDVSLGEALENVFRGYRFTPLERRLLQVIAFVCMLTYADFLGYRFTPLEPNKALMEPQ